METPFHYALNRREFLKRAAAVGLSASSAAALLEACGGSGGSSNGPVTVNLYHTIPAATTTYWQQTLLPPFEKQYPNLKLATYELGIENAEVIYTKIKAGGSAAPDLVWLDSTSTGTFVQAGLLADVDTWLNQHPTIKSDILPAILNISSFQGKVWSLPWMTNNTGMQINLDAFEQAGVPVPSQDPTKTWTWDEFAEACKLISQKTKMKGFLMNNGGPGWDSWLFLAWIGTAGGAFLSDAGDPLFNSAAGVETMTFLQNLVQDGYTAYGGPGLGYDPSPWYAQKAAIHPNGPWNFPDLQKFTAFKFTVVPYPVNKQPATNPGGDQLYLFNNSPQKVTYEFDYGQYMLTDDFQVKFNIESGNLPVTKTATANAAYQAHLQQYPFLYGWVNSVPYSVPRSSLPQANDVGTAFGQNAWDPIILKGANVQQALAKAAQAVEALKQ